MSTSLTDSTRKSFLEQVAEWQPSEFESSKAAIDLLIGWSESHGPLVARPAKNQSTVAFAFSRDRILWRAYPGKDVPTKIVVLPGLRTELRPTTRAALVAALEAAVLGVEIEQEGHLQCPLASIADEACFERFSVFLAAALAAGRSFDSSES